MLLRRCALRARTVFPARIDGIRAGNTVLTYKKNGSWVLYKIVDCARMVSIRAQSTIRADGTPSAQIATLQQLRTRFESLRMDRSKRPTDKDFHAPIPL